jgi:hypothetical protein
MLNLTTHGILAEIQFTISLSISSLKTVKIKIYTTVILSAVLYGREILSFTLRDKHKCRVFVNRELKTII